MTDFQKKIIAILSSDNDKMTNIVKVKKEEQKTFTFGLTK